MTGQELLDYIVRTFKRTDKNTELLEAITDTIMDLKSRHLFDQFSEEVYSNAFVTLGEYKLDLPTNFVSLAGEARVIDGDNGFPLTQRSKALFDVLYPNPNATSPIEGRPTDFCIFGGQILLGPVPDSLSYIYEFSYSTEDVTQITVATANVPFSTLDREALKYGTLRRAYVDLGLDEEAIKWASHYEDKIEKMILRDSEVTKGIASTQYNDL